MSSRRTTSDAAALREQVAQVAARLMSEHGITDFGLAKRKAAEQFGVTGRGVLPSNRQIEARLAERQRIFEPERHESRLRAARAVAVRVMGWLDGLEPRLVGPVLAGTATSNTAVEIHAFADAPDEIAHALERAGVAWRDCERRYRFSAGRASIIPGYRLVCDDVDVVVLAFRPQDLREPPLSAVDQRPLRRAGLAEVMRLLAE